MPAVTLVCPDPRRREELGQALKNLDDVCYSDTAELAHGLLVVAPDSPREALNMLRAATTSAGILLVLPRGSGAQELAWRKVLPLVDDFVNEDAAFLCDRVEKNIERRLSYEQLDAARLNAEVILELTQTLVSSLDFQDILFTVVRRIAEVFGVSRASVIVTPTEGTEVGYVVATSDDSDLRNIEIDLWKYPEIRAVRRSRCSLTIEDIATHELFQDHRDRIPGNVRGVTLFPIMWKDDAIGVLFLRHHLDAKRLSARTHQLCQAVANTTGIALHNVRFRQTLEARSSEHQRAQLAAEKQIAELERFAELFAASGDGMVVVTRSGAVRFANPRALEMISARSEMLPEMRLFERVHDDDKENVRRIWSNMAAGVFERSADVRVLSMLDEWLTLSFSFTGIGGDDVLMTFQDVTEQRRTEAELVKTMEFLESLINASVDGIVAADMSGNVILFNKGAEEIYGYTAAEAVGRMNTRELYLPGEAVSVMRKLRSEDYGGFGRLHPTQVTAVDKNGESIPIRLSASIIFEDGKPSATFGIFTDMRERLRVQERLAEAQQRLATSEKHAVVAEVAGAAAHELNQPLTSLMGYAELLKRKLGEDAPEYRAAEVIYREAERMASIVRKLGQATTYETREYVGEQRILDITSKSD